MNKIINKLFLATALVALVLTSCSDEADVLDNKPIKNKKTVEESLRPYPEFEEISINAEDVISLLLDFNQAMNGEIEMSDMQIDTALLLMETYFNYGVVDKQSNYDLSSTYEETSFEFTLNLINENQLTGFELQEGFTEFLNNVKSDMSGKYLKFSDLYVSEYDGASITFKLIIPPYTQEEYDMWPSGVPVVRVLKTNEDPLNIPSYYTIDWMEIFNNEWYARDYKSANLCLKTEPGFYYSVKQEFNIIFHEVSTQCKDGNGNIILDAYVLENYSIPNLISFANSCKDQSPNYGEVIELNSQVGYRTLTGFKTINPNDIYCAALVLKSFTRCHVEFGMFFSASLINVNFQ